MIIRLTTIRQFFTENKWSKDIYRPHGRKLIISPILLNYPLFIMKNTSSQWAFIEPILWKYLLSGALVHFLGTSLHGPTWTEQDLSTEDLEMEEKINSEENNEKEKSEAKTNGKTGEKKKRKKLTDLLRRRKISNSGIY